MAALTADRLDHFATELGVTREALQRLRAGWDGEALTFPMSDAGENTVGIRRRFPDKRKLSVAGGREGLFVPVDLPADGPLLVTEGPTDAAALLSLGFAAVGRPSCRGGVKLVCEICRTRDVVIVADSDEPGQIGAEALAVVLALFSRSAKIIRPPACVKDARAWLQAGATRADVLAAIEAARPLCIPIVATTTRRGGWR